jgi:hypothetical protein
MTKKARDAWIQGAFESLSFFYGDASEKFVWTMLANSIPDILSRCTIEQKDVDAIKSKLSKLSKC